MTPRRTSPTSRITWENVLLLARRIMGEYPPRSVTLRQVHYRCAAAGAIPNTTSAYKRLSSLIAQERRAGSFPDLIDSTREVHRPQAFADVADMLRCMPDSFRLDRRRGQGVNLYVAAEKDTLRVQFTGWLEDYGIPVVIARGFSSQSYVQDVAAAVRADGRDAVLLYVGDLDASGEDIERDWLERTACWDRVERVALNMAQVREREIPAAVGKRTDSRWPAFAARHGLDVRYPVQWEVEALPPEELRQLVMAAVHVHFARAVWESVLGDEEEQRVQLRRFLARWRSTG
ncbi:hypothetical protein GCM10009544_28390 [Streptomyces stramineus]|uniref:Uncharacterized protein n=1 Tax=Streptomyces stramineus TaxID=173861 RepID=A0ABP3JUD0_9ACTN